MLHPPRIAFALLADPLQQGPASGVIPAIDHTEARLLHAMLEKRVNCPLTTSLGRIFDAAAAILGLVETASYEGEGPIRLEGMGLRAYDPSVRHLDEEAAAGLLPFLGQAEDARLFLIDPRPLLARLMADRTAGRIPALSLLFHEGIAHASFEGARRLRRATGVSRLALSGGVFQNLLLRELLVPLLIKDGFEVFLNEQAPPGDGGLSVGQAWFQER